MRLFASLALAVALTLAFVSPSLAHLHQARRHRDVARRDPGEVQLHRRGFNNARLTFYAVGLGSCGQTSQPSDFIVALNAAQYSGGSFCFQQITITANGKTAQATILDECPGCPYGGLDLSLGLFQFFADVSAGVLSGSWDFGSGPSPTTSSTPYSSSTPAYTPSSTPTPTPTTTSTSIATTSSVTSSSSQSSSSTSSSSSSSSVAPSPSSKVAVTAGESSNPSVLGDVNVSIVLIGQFLGFCSGLQ